MVVAFCLCKYFPFGGLQRDFMRIARTIAARGHHVRVYTQSWEGEYSDVFGLIEVSVKSHINRGRNAECFTWMQKHLHEHPVDRVVGFNKILGLGVYYAADVRCAEKVAQERDFSYHLASRYRYYAAFERATFKQSKPTQLLMLTGRQITDFQKHYQAETERFHILPPGIYPDRKYNQQPANSHEIFRRKNGITEQQYLLLQVGSDFTRRGVDRSIEALASLPDSLRYNTLLYVVGQDKPRKFETLAEKRSVRSNAHFFPGRNDVPELMAAVDLLLHPAYQETAEIILLGAITARSPVLTTAACSYTYYIVDASCDEVTAEPFRQETLNETLRKALTQSSLRQAWTENARHYADTQDSYNLPEKATDIITGDLGG